MKKLLAVTGCVLISVIIISSYASAHPSGGKTDTGEGSPLELTEYNQKNGYIVSIFAGKVAIFRESDEQVLFTTNTFADDLPKADRDMLQKGIIVPTMRDAEKLIQSYCS